MVYYEIKKYNWYDRVDVAYVSEFVIIGGLGCTPYKNKAQKFYKSEEKEVEKGIAHFGYKFKKHGNSESRPRKSVKA